MIGRLILMYPDEMRRTGVFFLLGLIMVALYGLGISPAWIGQMLPATAADWLVANPVLVRLLGAVMIVLISAANWNALRQLPRCCQVIGVWIELFVLLMLFFYSFNLSFAFVAKKAGFYTHGKIRGGPEWRMQRGQIMTVDARITAWRLIGSLHPMPTTDRQNLKSCERNRALLSWPGTAPGRHDPAEPLTLRLH